MKKLFFLILLLCFIGVGVYAGSPYYRAYQMQQAYSQQNGQAIAAVIDYPKVTADVEQQLSQRLQTTLTTYPMLQQLGGSALNKMGQEFIKTSVQQAITPDNISTLVNSQGKTVNEASKKLAVAWAVSSNKIDLTGLIQQLIQGMLLQQGDIKTVIQAEIEKKLATAATNNSNLQNQLTDKPVLAYCGVNCFNISTQVKGYPFTITMQRQQWIDWQVVAVELP